MNPEWWLVGVGVLLAIVGLTWLVGPVALVVSGVLLVVAGLLVPEEALRGKPAQPPRR